MIPFQGDDGRLLLRGSHIVAVKERSWRAPPGEIDREVRIEMSNGTVFAVKETFEAVMSRLKNAGAWDAPPDKEPQS